MRIDRNYFGTGDVALGCYVVKNGHKWTVKTDDPVAAIAAKAGANMVTHADAKINGINIRVCPRWGTVKVGGYDVRWRSSLDDVEGFVDTSRIEDNGVRVLVEEALAAYAMAYEANAPQRAKRAAQAKTESERFVANEAADQARKDATFAKLLGH